MPERDPVGPTDQSDPTDHAGVVFHPPVLLAVLIAAGFVLRWAAPMQVVPLSVSRTLGPFLTAASFGLAGWAAVTFRKRGTSVPTYTPTDAIVSTGPYRLSRNPIYVSMALLLVGLGVWTNSGWFWLLAVISVLLLTFGVIVREERYLARKFGHEFDEYRSRVRRWI